jgi:hypothetical protein
LWAFVGFYQDYYGFFAEFLRVCCRFCDFFDFLMDIFANFSGFLRVFFMVLITIRVMTVGLR